MALMRRTLLPVALLIMPLFVLVTPAGAVPPESETFFVDDTFTDTELCSFPVSVHFVGRIKFITHFDQEGNLVFDSALPSFRITVTNPETGKSFRDGDVGLDMFTPTPDGGGVVLSTGVHFHLIPVGGGAPIFTRVGLQLIVVFPDGSDEIQVIGGNFDPIEEFEQVACSFLADP
jgi:hypothetical protein